MIPYPELVAALERWRVRNGLPIGGGGMPPMSMSATPASYTPPPASFAPASVTPMTSPPRPAPGAPPAAKVPVRPQTDEPLDLGDADVLDEDVLAPEAGDFAMAFGVSTSTSSATTAPSPVFDDDEVADERTAIGNPGEPLSPFTSEPGAGLDTYDADDDVLGEEDDLDPRHKP